MRLTLIIALTAALIGTSMAYCPNACSGHGSCNGKHDMCTCDAGFQGSDCSLRTCPFATSWATTAQGDVNHNGNTNDVTVYRSDIHYRNSIQSYVIDQRTKQSGTWERWPSIFTPGKDEGHFYMECSNRGTCDRKTGQCVCFDGYTGEACRRTVCPTTTAEDCSGHGTCETVADLVAEDSAISEAYKLWDGEMSRACKCDPGYTGIDCANRLCPRGDDPLTAAIYNSQTSDVDQRDETQSVQISAPAPAKDLSDVSTTKFAGAIKLEYTDYFGQTWVTDAIVVKPYWELVTTSAVTSTETAVKNALKALPNGAVLDVDVVAMPCATVVTGDVAATNDCNDADLADGSSYICGNDFTQNAYFSCDGTTATAFGTAVSAGSAGTCHLVNPNCLQLDITFTGNPGNLQNLVPDHSDVTVNGKNNFQIGSNTAGSATTTTRAISDNTGLGGAYFGIEADDNGALSCATSDACSTTAGNVQITLITSLNAHQNLCKGCLVRMTCDGINMGTYTVDSIAGDGSTVDFVEKVTTTCATSSALKLDLKTHFLTVDADLTAYLSDGDVLQNSCIVDQVNWGANAYQQTVLCKKDTTSTGSFTGTVFSKDGTGTKESSECSDRGVCDGATGECNCFRGYTGAACSEQNELAV